MFISSQPRRRERWLILFSLDLMRFAFLLLLLGTVSTGFVYPAEPPPIPTPEIVAEWASFEPKVALNRHTDKQGDAPKWGKLVWSAEYNAPKETLTSLSITLYEPGTFRYNGRLEKIRELAQSLADKPENQRFSRIDKLPSDRELLSFVGGFGPGGGLFLAFGHSKDGRYDILLGIAGSSEKNVPTENRLQKPAELKTSVRDLFLAVDAYVSAH